MVALATVVAASLVPSGLPGQSTGEQANPDEGPARETSAIVGRAYVADGEHPLAGAVIYVEGSELTGVADADGVFRIGAFQPGIYRLSLYHPSLGELGWAGPPTQLVLVPSGTVIEMDFALSAGGAMVEVGGPGSNAQPYQLDPVVVVGRRTVYERVEREGARVDVVDRGEIEDLETSASHIGDLLRGFASLRVSEPHSGAVCVESRRRTTDTPATALGGRTNVNPLDSYRRVERSCPKMVQVYIDDVRAPLAEYLISGLRSQDVERIEYVNGVAAGARFGTGAAEGILLIYTRLPRSR